MGWSPEQTRNAHTIVQVGQRMGASKRDIQIALMAAMVESNLVNVAYGDRDSVGLFQQRAPWGSFQQRTNPAESARMFFQGGHGGQHGLFSFSNRNSMAMGAAAQAVQVSAFPDRYAQRAGAAAGLMGQLGVRGGTAGTLGAVPGLPSVIQTHHALDMTPTDPADALADDPTVSANTGLGEMGDDATNGRSPLDALSFGMPAYPEQVKEDPMSDLHVPGVDAFRGGGGGGYGGDGIGGGVNNIPGATPEHSGGIFDNLGGYTDDAGGGGGGAHGWREQVVKDARKMLGVPYVWGASSPTAVDCSGLVQLIYGQMGVNLPRVSNQQARFGHAISIDAVRPGDLIAYDNSSRNNGADHIAIAIGHGQMIEAARPGTNVQVTNIYPGGWGVRMSRPGGYEPPHPAPHPAAHSAPQAAAPSAPHRVPSRHRTEHNVIASHAAAVQKNRIL